MITLPILEVFSTFQGEGVHMGIAAFFIRTIGCPVQCPWCDSASTWHPNYKPKIDSRLRFTALELDVLVRASGARICVITGGEPAIHDLTELTNELLTLKDGKYIATHIETCGAFELKGTFSWITLSPKWSAMPTADNLSKANEIKLIVETPDSIDKWLEQLGRLSPLTLRSDIKTPKIWLHPEWSQRDNPEVLNAITEAVKRNPYVLRAGWQLHKLYKADALDSGSAPLVPLGGDPSKGY